MDKDKIKNTIKALENQRDYYSGGISKGVCELAIQSLQKQIPMKIIKKHGTYVCPICDDSVISIGGREAKYCDECGQRLDWREENVK